MKTIVMASHSSIVLLWLFLMCYEEVPDGVIWRAGGITPRGTHEGSAVVFAQFHLQYCRCGARSRSFGKQAVVLTNLPDQATLNLAAHALLRVPRLTEGEGLSDQYLT